MHAKVVCGIPLFLLLGSPCFAADDFGKSQLYGRITYGPDNLPASNALIKFNCHEFGTETRYNFIIKTDDAGQYAINTVAGQCILNITFRAHRPISHPVHVFHTRTRANFYMDEYDGKWLLIRR